MLRNWKLCAHQRDSYQGQRVPRRQGGRGAGGPHAQVDNHHGGTHAGWCQPHFGLYLQYFLDFYRLCCLNACQFCQIPLQNQSQQNIIQDLTVDTACLDPNDGRPRARDCQVRRGGAELRGPAEAPRKRREKGGGVLRQHAARRNTNVPGFASTRNAGQKNPLHQVSNLLNYTLPT